MLDLLELSGHQEQSSSSGIFFSGSACVFLLFFILFLYFFFQKYSRLFLSSETRPFILLYMYISIYFFALPRQQGKMMIVMIRNIFPRTIK